MSDDLLLPAVPGRIPHDIFHQDEIWIDRHGRAFRLSDMSEAYLRNLLGFLIHNAPRFRTFEERWAIRMGLDEAERGAGPFDLRTKRRLEHIDWAPGPWSWIAGTTLWFAIEAEVLRRGTARAKGSNAHSDPESGPGTPEA